ncbi:MAG: 30S ribosomal protein S6 [Eubacteriales bacterium]|nr:30S ribosomal protein S6 [Eubacteriales bacterium]
MVNYELMVVIDPSLDEAKRNELLENIKNIIAADGEVTDVNEKDWGLRKLAYPIEKKSEGYYVVVEFQAEPTLPKELDRRLRISDSVMRHIIVNKDEK